MRGTSIFGLVLVVVGLVVFWQMPSFPNLATPLLGLAAYTLGVLIWGLASGIRAGARAKTMTDPEEGGSKVGGLRRGLSLASPEGLAMLVVGAWLTTRGVWAWVGVPMLAAGTLACAWATIAGAGDGQGLDRRILGGLFLAAGWVAVGVATFAIARVVGADGRRLVPLLIAGAIGGPLAIALGTALRTALPRRDRLVRLGIVAGVLLITAATNLALRSVPVQVTDPARIGSTRAGRVLPAAGWPSAVR